MKKCNKDPIVFIPGWGFKASVWSNIGEKFSHHKVIYCDLPKLTQGNNKLEIVAEDLVPVIPENSILIGWSLGGLIAIYLSSKYYELCKKLILVASTPKFTTITEHFIVNAKTDLSKVVMQFLQLTQYPNHSPSIRANLKKHIVNIQHEEQTLISYLELLQMTDLSELFQKLTTPTLQIHGTKDAIVSNLVSKGIVELIDNAGHVHFITHRNQFLTALENFLYE